MKALPSTVIIAGQEWVVKTNKKSGGSFDAGKCVITVGTKYPQDVFMVFLHEVFEAILMMRGYRYYTYDASGNPVEYLFNFCHREFDNMMYDVALALRDFPLGGG